MVQWEEEMHFVAVFGIAHIQYPLVLFRTLGSNNKDTSLSEVVILLSRSLFALPSRSFVVFVPVCHTQSVYLTSASRPYLR